jgi:opacity protein-like surface antigen
MIEKLRNLPFLFAAAIFCAASLTAVGQTAEFTISGGNDNLTNKDIGSGYSLDSGAQIAFRLTLNTGRWIGHEGGYAYNRSHLKQSGTDLGGMAIHQGFYDFLFYLTPEGNMVRPFACGGAQFANFVPPGASVTQGGVQGGNKFGFNYGGGLKFWVNKKWIIRLDFRQYSEGKPFDLGGSGQIKQNVASIGFGIGI